MLKEHLPWSLNSVLGALDACLRQSVDWQEWGIENRLIQSLKNSLDNPAIQESERLERASESMRQLFVTMFLNSLSRLDIASTVERISFSGRDTTIELAVYLKPGQGDFYHKSKFYSTITALSRVPLFRNHTIDFRLLNAGPEVPLSRTGPFALETTLRSISVPRTS